VVKFSGMFLITARSHNSPRRIVRCFGCHVRSLLPYKNKYP
jgi:hypothetical protein